MLRPKAIHPVLKTIKPVLKLVGNLLIKLVFKPSHSIQHLVAFRWLG